MKLSENHLFNFTNESALLSIIKEGFIPFFGFEFTDLDDHGRFPIRIEMFPRICFTDLPLNLIEKHVRKYDSFAIGMSKEWAIRNSLNPLLYIQKNSIVGSTLSMLTESILDLHQTMRDSKINSARLEYIFQRLVDLNHMIGRYTKPYEIETDRTITNEETNTDLKIKADRFYDEREWRFVPYIKIEELIDENAWPFTVVSKEDLLRVSRKYIRTFELNDIVSIVVPNKGKKKLMATRIAKRYGVTELKVYEEIEFIIL